MKRSLACTGLGPVERGARSDNRPTDRLGDKRQSIWRMQADSAARGMMSPPVSDFRRLRESKQFLKSLQRSMSSFLVHQSLGLSFSSQCLSVPGYSSCCPRSRTIPPPSSESRQTIMSLFRRMMYKQVRVPELRYYPLTS